MHKHDRSYRNVLYDRIGVYSRMVVYGAAHIENMRWRNKDEPMPMEFYCAFGMKERSEGEPEPYRAREILLPIHSCSCAQPSWQKQTHSHTLKCDSHANTASRAHIYTYKQSTRCGYCWNWMDFLTFERGAFTRLLWKPMNGISTCKPSKTSVREHN